MKKLVQFRVIISLLLLCAFVHLTFHSVFYFEGTTQKNSIKISIEKAPLLDFDDKNFRPLLDVFKFGPPFLKLKEGFRYSKIPTILMMSELTPSSFWKVQAAHLNEFICPLPCRITDRISDLKKADAIGFYNWDYCELNKAIDKLVNKGRDLSQPWILFAIEPPTIAYPMLSECRGKFDGIFNRTVSYRTDADVRAYHGFIVNRKEASFLPSDWVLPYPALADSRKRKLAAIFLSRCGSPSGRSEYIRDMQMHSKEVHVYGDCGKLKCSSRRSNDVDYKISEDKCYKHISRKYMFYLSFENSICKEYATEKIYNIMFYPVVPIVLGGADYVNLLPPHSYINAADYTPEKLVKYLEYLRENLDEYKQYFQWKNYFKPSTIESERSLCDLCIKMHDPEFYKLNVYTNFSKWFEDEAKCNQTWNRHEGVHEIDARTFYDSI